MYYLQSRYYDPAIGRFINADTFASSGQGFLGCNMFAYCGNNPISRVDSNGDVFDTILDVVFIGYDIYKLIANKGYKKWRNWAALGADIAMAAIPFASGAGQIIRTPDIVKGITSLSKVTVIGETMDRVKAFAKTVGALDNLYGGFKAYPKLSALGKGGIILAEIGGKATNIAWLYNKLRSGFTVFDIGIDVLRSTRSSSYIVEQIVIGIWTTQNVIKGIYHSMLEMTQ